MQVPGCPVSVDQLLELTELLGFGEGLDHDLQEGLGGVPVLGSCGVNSVTVRACARLSRSSALSISPHALSDGAVPAIRVLRQRRVEEVDEVDVEVDGQTVTGGERRDGGSGAA